MKTLVAYYSNFGSNKSLSEEIASRLGADLDEITEGKKRTLPLGFAIAFLRSILHIYPKISQAKNPADYDLVILSAPVWAGGLALPMKAYIAKNRRKFRKIAYACISGGANNPKVVPEIENLSGIKVSASIDLAVVEPGTEPKEKDKGAEMMTMHLTREDLKKEYYANGIDSFIKKVLNN